MQRVADLWLTITAWMDVFLLLAIFAAFFVAMVAWSKAVREKR